MHSKQTKSFPVPAVRLIVRNPEGKVLLLRRHAGSTGAGGWCLPGGKVDYGSTVADTVARELREETSLVCETMQFLFYQDSLPEKQGLMHCINLYFECSVSGDLRLNRESAEHAWIERADLDRFEIVFRNAEGLRRYWNQGT